MAMTAVEDRNLWRLINRCKELDRENAELKLAVSVLQRELADAETRAAYFAAELVSIKEPLRGEIT
jgi:hypothetical protein